MTVIKKKDNRIIDDIIQAENKNISKFDYQSN